MDCHCTVIVSAVAKTHACALSDTNCVPCLDDRLLMYLIHHTPEHDDVDLFEVKGAEL